MTDTQLVADECPGCGKPVAPGHKWCQRCIYEANIVQSSDPEQQFAIIAELVQYVRDEEQARIRQALLERRAVLAYPGSGRLTDAVLVKDIDDVVGST